MLERLVESWLTSLGELGYQTPFAQLLLAEGHVILFGPVHHPFEHGKDIVTIDPSGRLCAFQLKGPDEIADLDGFGRYQGQLDALSAAVIEHPAIGGRRLPDVATVVTNGVLRPEVRDRINLISAGNQLRGLAPLAYIEKDQLVARFLAIHGRYLPSAPASFRAFVQLYADPGTGPLPVPAFLRFLEGLLPFGDTNPPRVECQRALASAALFAAYCLGGWTNSGHHMAVAQGWLLYCCAALRLAEERKLPPSLWKSIYDLAFTAARVALRSLLNEACDAEDLVRPHIAEAAFYGTRALQVCGYIAAHFLSERLVGEDGDIRVGTSRLIRREARYIRTLGEAAAPFVFAIADAEALLTSSSSGEALVNLWLTTIIRNNQQRSSTALPDPYHTLEELLAEQVGARDSSAETERYDGHAYTAHIAVEWLSRRLRRQALASAWPAYSRLLVYEFRCSSPSKYLTIGDEQGQLSMMVPDQPGSWASIRRSSLQVKRGGLPSTLWDNPELLPFIGLLFPPRFTAELCTAIDYHWFRSADYSVEAVPAIARPDPRHRKRRVK